MYFLLNMGFSNVMLVFRGVHIFTECTLAIYFDCKPDLRRGVISLTKPPQVLEIGEYVDPTIKINIYIYINYTVYSIRIHNMEFRSSYLYPPSHGFRGISLHNSIRPFGSPNHCPPTQKYRPQIRAELKIQPSHGNIQPPATTNWKNCTCCVVGLIISPLS